ncbi:phage holin family protein [Alkaliphilus hydrothermalis]|uniref:Uncharacterized membrane protein YvlD (DUF360 family) n=1 Tax=Alkaliphilus hydrothermalis TaxID=1482730 RepID=A0ABS2NRR3_9FIRM|nr:phage holin family protein [Alkaliphilus hydrothermalis]MBM7615264.1 uncharacterized membrane protein YvlD (DUF360 family) [Alkaliphilus hydrothermalis]
MSDEHLKNARISTSGGWVSFILRFVLSSVVIAVAAFLTPGFSIRGLWSILIAAAVISLADYLINRVFKLDASPFGRGLTGFVVASVVIYGTQFFVPAMRVTILGAIIGAVIIGLLDMIMPGKTL